MEADLMEDVKAELTELDTANPPAAGQDSLLDVFEQRIKREPLDDVPGRDVLPFPPSTARDVAMEVQKVKENRDRFRIEGRTGGVGPGLSVTMFTFHNTFDSINCLEFSGDNTLVAAGTSESYIRVWSLDNQALTSPTDPPSYTPSSSRRLVGHSGPVYSLSFSPSIAIPEPSTNGHTNNSISPDSHPRYLLSSSADNTICLWSLDTWTNLVVYRSHTMPVWDVRFSPQGHYFVSASADRTARLWSTPQIAPLRLFVGHDADVECVAWHPNSAYVFTGSGGGDRTVRMWDVQRGQAVRIFTGHTGNVTALMCAPTDRSSRPRTIEVRFCCGTSPPADSRSACADTAEEGSGRLTGVLSPQSSSPVAQTAR
jgi:transcription initiation factor TFIID subunit 5